VAKHVRACWQGKKVVDIRLEPASANSIVPALGRSKGKVGFQTNGGTVRYRKIEIKELPPAKTGAAPPKVVPPTPVDDGWLKSVAAMSTAKQVDAVAKKLQDLNPDFDGKTDHKVHDGVVTELQFVTDHVTDISPVRALTGLRTLDCRGGGGYYGEIKGRLADLSPLQDMKLTTLICGGTQVVDLSPLKDMKLTWLK
jgi:hypothetical protein